MRRRRRGFALIELMIALVVASILARIALPAYRQIVTRARAAEVVGDFKTVRLAAITYYSENDSWPADTWPGVMPDAFAPHLPDGFSFDRGDYQLDWENWILPDGTPKHPDTQVLIGVSVTTSDAALGSAVVDLLGNSVAHYTLGDNYTFVIEAL